MERKYSMFGERFANDMPPTTNFANAETCRGGPSILCVSDVELGLHIFNLPYCFSNVVGVAWRAGSGNARSNYHMMREVYKWADYYRHTQRFSRVYCSFKTRFGSRKKIKFEGESLARDQLIFRIKDRIQYFAGRVTSQSRIYDGEINQSKALIGEMVHQQKTPNIISQFSCFVDGSYKKEDQSSAWACVFLNSYGVLMDAHFASRQSGSPVEIELMRLTFAINRGWTLSL